MENDSAVGRNLPVNGSTSISQPTSSKSPRKAKRQTKKDKEFVAKLKGLAYKANNGEGWGK